MLPSLVQLANISGKRGRDEDDKTEAEKLLSILMDLPSPSDSEDFKWVLSLSDKQFDMLLAARLYTGSLYRVLTSVLLVEDDIWFQPNKDPTVDILKDMKEQSHPNEALYFAVLNAMRRLPGKMKGLLIVQELGEFNPMSEPAFRTLATRSLTDYTVEEGPKLFSSTLNRMIDRINGNGLGYDQLPITRTVKGKSSLAKDALDDFWTSMCFTADALRSFILESNTVVGKDSLAVYRGMKEELKSRRVEMTFVSVTRDETIARQFTNDPYLEYEEEEIGAPNQCCMLRITLLPGTPYLDIETVLKNSNGWGFALGEEELLLPPGLKWEFVEDKNDPRVATFPDEIRVSVEEEGDEEGDGEKSYKERYYRVGYYVVGQPSPGSASES